MYWLLRTTSDFGLVKDFLCVFMCFSYLEPVCASGVFSPMWMWLNMCWKNVYNITFVTVKCVLSSSISTKTCLWPGLHPGPCWGSLQCGWGEHPFPIIPFISTPSASRSRHLYFLAPSKKLLAMPTCQSRCKKLHTHSPSLCQFKIGLDYSVCVYASISFLWPVLFSGSFCDFLWVFPVQSLLVGTRQTLWLCNADVNYCCALRMIRNVLFRCNCDLLSVPFTDCNPRTSLSVPEFWIGTSRKARCANPFVNY